MKSTVIPHNTIITHSFHSVPLRDRVFRSSCNSHVSVAQSLLHTGDIEREPHKLWTQQQMKSVVYSVLDEGMSIRRAALWHGVPKSSLGDSVSGRAMVDAQCRPATYLSQREEEELVQFLT